VLNVTSQLIAVGPAASKRSALRAFLPIIRAASFRRHIELRVAHHSALVHSNLLVLPLRSLSANACAARGAVLPALECSRDGFRTAALLLTINSLALRLLAMPFNNAAAAGKSSALDCVHRGGTTLRSFATKSISSGRSWILHGSLCRVRRIDRIGRSDLAACVQPR